MYLDPVLLGLFVLLLNSARVAKVSYATCVHTTAAHAILLKLNLRMLLGAA